MSDMEGLTASQIKEVPCIVCGAAVGEPCKNVPMNKEGEKVKMFPGFRAGAHVVGYHAARAAMRKKYPVVDYKTLNATDISLIVYYGYVMLADACEANAKALFGRHFTSADIQRFFAAKATQQLIKDGLLDPPNTEAKLVADEEPEPEKKTKIRLT
jgi:hypothetical protein